MLGFVFIATQKKSNPTYASALLFNGSDVGRTLVRRVAPEIKAIQIVHILIDQELKAHSLNFQEQQAIYRDFRTGDIRHSNADITRAQDLVNYTPHMISISGGLRRLNAILKILEKRRYESFSHRYWLRRIS